MISTITRAETAAATDPGRKRSGNEDSHAIWKRAGSHPDTLLVVCDGMGGSNAGEVASRMTVDACVRHFAEELGDDPSETLVRAVEAANAEVWQHTQSRPDLQGMGTTCTALALRDDQVFVAHVGDSRAYLVRQGRIRQLTQDHSLVAQLVAQHHLTPEQARHDPRRNVVTRCIGIAPTVEVDVVTLDPPSQPGDTFLLCSDGLHGQVEEHELARLASEGSLDRACRQLIQLANDRGGPDNITVLLARLEDPGGTAIPGRPTRKASVAPPSGGQKRRTLQLLIAALAALLVVLCGFAWVVFGMLRQPQASRTPSASETSR